jgi:hypothetical protein
MDAASEVERALRRIVEDAALDGRVRQTASLYAFGKATDAAIRPSPASKSCEGGQDRTGAAHNRLDLMTSHG